MSRSHNRLVGSVRGVDGIKTGYTRAAGFNLVSSLQVDGKSIVGVVLGGASTPARDSQMRTLLATYLPKASANGGTLVAQSKPVPEMIETPAPVSPAKVAQLTEKKTIAANQSPVTAAAADLGLPPKGPLPDSRYQTARTEVAYAETAARKTDNPLLTQPMPSPTKVKTVAIKQQQEQASVAVPTPAPAYMPPEQGDTSVDELTTASTKAAPAKEVAAREMPQPSGWVVQIGVSSNRETAMDLLANAKAKGGKALSSAKPFAVAYGNGGDQIYRARFGGFDEQRDAVNACKALKKAGIKCWAAAQ